MIFYYYKEDETSKIFYSHNNKNFITILFALFFLHFEKKYIWYYKILQLQ